MTFLSNKKSTSKLRQNRPPPILTSSAPTTPIAAQARKSIHFTPDTKGSPNLSTPTALPPTPTSPLSRMFRWPSRKVSSPPVTQTSFFTPPKSPVQSSDIHRHVANKDSVSSTCTTNSQSSFFADTYIARNSVVVHRDALPDVSEEDQENVPPFDSQSPLKSHGKALPSHQSQIKLQQIDPRADLITRENPEEEASVSFRADNYYYARIASPPRASASVSAANSSTTKAAPIRRQVTSRHQRQRSNSFGGIATPAPYDLKASKIGKHAEYDSPSQFASLPNRASNRKSVMILTKPPTSVKKTLPVIQRAAAIRDKYLSGKKSPAAKQSPPMIVPTLRIVPATPVVEGEEFPARKSQDGGPSLAQQIAERMAAAKTTSATPEPFRPNINHTSSTDTITDIVVQRQRMENRDSTATVLPVKSFEQSMASRSPAPRNISRDSTATITRARPIIEQRLSYGSQTSPTTASDLSNTSASTENSTVPSSIFKNAPALTNSSSVSSITSFESHAFSDASDSDAECVPSVSTPKQKYVSTLVPDITLNRKISVASNSSYECELDCEEQLDSMLASLSYGNEISDIATKEADQDTNELDRELELELEIKLMSNFGITPLEVRTEQPAVDFGLPQIPSTLRERRLSSWFLTKSGSSSSSLSKRAGGYVSYIPSSITPPLTPDASSPELEAIESLDQKNVDRASSEDPSTPKLSKTFSQHMVNSQSLAYTKSLEKTFSSSQLPWLYETSDVESLGGSTDDGYGCATDDEEVATVQTGVRLYSTGAEVGLAL